MTKNNETAICPLCLDERSEFDRHHVIWRSEGGTDDPVNILPICRTCHAIASFGNSEDAGRLNAACADYMLALHGLGFWERSGAFSDKYTSMRPRGAEFRRHFSEFDASGGDRAALDAMLREWHRWSYLFRLAGAGVLDEIWNDDDFDSAYNPNWIEPATPLEKALRIREYQRAARAYHDQAETEVEQPS